MGKRDLTKQQRQSNIKRRRRKESIFYSITVMATGMAVLFLAVLLISICGSGVSAFYKTEIQLNVEFDPELLELSAQPTQKEIEEASTFVVFKKATKKLAPNAISFKQKRELNALVSSEAEYEIGRHLKDFPNHLGTTQTLWVTASSNLDQLHKGHIRRETPEASRKISNQQIAWYDSLNANGKIRTTFNSYFFTMGDSRSAEIAGIGAAIIGSTYALLICFLISFPLGVAAAIYLEEFAPKNRFTEFIEVNINNLAAVPSIIFGLLGLAVVLQLFGFPRSSPLAGGIVLSLMTLPTIIIACRASLKAVPGTIKNAALGLGASRVQAMFHHTFPLALPGTLTGTIIGLSRALGETAPLLMIGMVAFVVDIPATPMDPSTALPVQIYLWAESAERGFVERSSAAIMIILAFLIAMNLTAVLLRTKYQKSWT